MKEASISICITTAPRKEPTLERSLKSLMNSIGNTKGVEVNVSVDLYGIGCFTHYDVALNKAISKKKDFVMVVPDDMLYTEGWITRILDHHWTHKTGYIALYTPKGLGEQHNFKEGLNQIDGGWASSWGGCYLMQTKTARKLLKNTFYQGHLKGTVKASKYFNYEKNKRIDHCIPEAMYQMGIDQYFIAPSVCTHKGYSSTIGHIHTQEEDAFIPNS